jgi:hypothetical protein
MVGCGFGTVHILEGCDETVFDGCMRDGEKGSRLGIAERRGEERKT